MQVTVSPTSVNFSVSHTAVVNLYAKYADNQTMTSKITSIFDTITQTHFTHLSEFACDLDNEGSKRDVDVVLGYLRAHEERQNAVFDEHHRETMEHRKETVNTLKDYVNSQHLESHMRMISQQSLMISAIDTNVRAHLDFPRISADMVVMMKNCMAETNVCNDDMLVLKIKDAMQTLIVAPSAQASDVLLRSLQNIKDSWSQNNQSVNDAVLLNDKLNQIMLAITTDSIKTRNDIENVGKSLSEFVDDQYDSPDVSLQISHVPNLVKATMEGVMREVDASSRLMAANVSTLQQQMLKFDEVNALQLVNQGKMLKGTDDLTGKMAQMSAQMTISRTNIHAKGQQGEQTMLYLLEDVLTRREGFSVTMTQGIANNCDILIQKFGCNNVSVEMKAHGNGSAQKVRTRDVEKFYSDITRLGTSGIFVSLYSDIVGKDHLEIDPLPNGRFAIFIANNNHDVVMVKEMLLVLYRLEAITCKKAIDGSDAIIIPPETLAKIKAYLGNEYRKIEDVKRHVKQTTTMLNNVNLDGVLAIILAGHDDKDVVARDDVVVPHTEAPSDQVQIEVPRSSLQCAKCAKVYQHVSSLKTHEKKCKP